MGGAQCLVVATCWYLVVYWFVDAIAHIGKMVVRFECGVDVRWRMLVIRKVLVLAS